MVRFAMALIMFGSAGSALAQQPPGGGTQSASPDVTVRGPERMVCRNVTRTATRMRSSRVCRPVSQLHGDDRQGQDERLADAADTLEILGEKVSTNCIGGLSREDDTPLGPR